ncbi:MAG: Uma2 family endonuclease [Gammaproteobacteria bacterium]|nr:Uma2 family endonuclease [Gammaproteobacteria bacterium]MDE0442314.1 Uma2 family endonuclease [Gammaproteobacteria bacterium]
MQSTVVSPHHDGSPEASRRRAGLAAVHAKALHRLVPPVYFDDDGYVCKDNSHVPESHFPIMSYWHGALYGHFRSRGRLVCVLADHLLLVDREVGTAAVVPDVMVAFEVEPGDRLSYKVWQEPKAPDLVLEVLSGETWRVDVFEKPNLYADLGVREYWIFDPRGIRRGGPPLEGWRLRAQGNHEPLAATGDGGWHSRLLGLDLVPGGKSVWLRDPETGCLLPDHAGAMESRDRAEAELQRAETERQRAEAERQRVLEENARLRAEIRRLRSGET